MTERCHGVQLSRAAGWNVTGANRCDCQTEGDDDKRQWISRTHTIEQVREAQKYAGEKRGYERAGGDADEGKPQSLANEHAQHVRLCCPERQADSNFRHTLSSRVGDDAVDSDGGQQQGQEGEGNQQNHGKALATHGRGNEFAHGTDVINGLLAIGSIDCILDGRYHSRGHKAGAYGEGNGVSKNGKRLVGKLVEGVVNLRLLACGCVDSVLFDVAEYADDTGGHSAGFAPMGNGYGLAERVAIRE